MVKAQIEGDYEEETGKIITERFRNANLNPIHTPGVLVKSHGPFTWGKDADEAVYHSVVLEEVAKMAYLTTELNPEAEMKDGLIEKHFSRKHGPKAYYGQR